MRFAAIEAEEIGDNAGGEAARGTETARIVMGCMAARK
jgi:hypothetical protein